MLCMPQPQRQALPPQPTRHVASIDSKSSTCSATLSIVEDGGSETVARVYHPGDTIHGLLHLTYGSAAVIDGVNMSLEGTMRTWVDHGGYSSALKNDFLKQSQRVHLRQLDSEKTESGFKYRIPFKFKIALQRFPNDGLSPRFATLPPSMSEGRASFDQHGNKCMQPFTQYGIRATVRHRANPQAAAELNRTFREFQFIPWTEAAPPMSVDDFSEEFCLTSKAELRKSISRSPLGEMMVSMIEPDPLPVFSNGAKGRTQGLLNVTLRSHRLLQDFDQLPRFACGIDIELIRLTFFSTMPMKAMASASMLSSHKYLRLRKDIVHSNSWSIDPLSWNCGPAGTKDASATCTAVVPIPITPGHELVPSFCGPLASVRYSLKIHFRLLHARHEKLCVVVPLNVFYRRPPEFDPSGRAASGGRNTFSIASFITDDTGEIESLPAYGA